MAIEAAISPLDLYARIGTASAPVLLDVRRAAAFDADDAVIVGALRHDPEQVVGWRRELPHDRTAVVYCVHGHEVSRGVADALRASGIEAQYLEGGITGWAELGLPRRKKVAISDHGWITRE